MASCIKKTVFISFSITLMFIRCVDSNSGMGHLQPLGSQRKSEGHIDVTKEIPDPLTFFNNYVKASKPLVFLGAAKKIPAFQKWTDEYLKKAFAHIKVNIEKGKKENRSLSNYWAWTFKDFLDKYQKEDVYMVHPLRREMLKDLVLFPCLSCGGYTKLLHDVIMWFSSGGTKSVLHFDPVDNINCLFSGSKQLYMVDWKHREFIDIDELQEGYSHVNVDAVDLDKYPGLSKAPWWEANMESGDCIYIPYKWFHQVRSFTNNKRNMAVNTWFYHMKKINVSECENNIGNTLTPMDQLQFGLQNLEAVRFVLLQQFENKTEMEEKKMVKSIAEYHSFGDIPEATWRSVIKHIDKNKDKKVTVEEINDLTREDLKVISLAFPGFNTEGEEEGAQGDEGDGGDEGEGGGEGDGGDEGDGGGEGDRGGEDVDESIIANTYKTKDEF